MAENFKPAKDTGDLFPGDTDFDQYQLVNHRLFLNRVPVAREVGEREIVFSKVSGVCKLHTKIQGVIVSVTLT